MGNHNLLKGLKATIGLVSAPAKMRLCGAALSPCKMLCSLQCFVDCASDVWESIQLCKYWHKNAGSVPFNHHRGFLSPEYNLDESKMFTVQLWQRIVTYHVSGFRLCEGECFVIVVGETHVSKNSFVAALVVGRTQSVKAFRWLPLNLIHPMNTSVAQGSATRLHYGTSPTFSQSGEATLGRCFGVSWNGS